MLYLFVSAINEENKAATLYTRVLYRHKLLILALFVIYWPVVKAKKLNLTMVHEHAKAALLM